MDELPYKAAFGIWGSYVCLLINVIALMAQFYVALYPVGGPYLDAKTFFELYLETIHLTLLDRNLAPVVGGERDLRMQYLPSFQRACLESLSIMTAYSSYDGVAAVADKRL